MKICSDFGVFSEDIFLVLVNACPIFQVEIEDKILAVIRNYQIDMDSDKSGNKKRSITVQ